MKPILREVPHRVETPSDTQSVARQETRTHRVCKRWRTESVEKTWTIFAESVTQMAVFP